MSRHRDTCPCTVVLFEIAVNARGHTYRPSRIVQDISAGHAQARAALLEHNITQLQESEFDRHNPVNRAQRAPLAHCAACAGVS